MTLDPKSNRPYEWVEYRMLVLAELERLGKDLDKLKEQVNVIHINLSQTITETRQTLLDKVRDTAKQTEDKQNVIAKELKGEFSRLAEDRTKREDQAIKAIDERYRAEINKLSKEIGWLRDELSDQSIDISSLKAKAAMLGGAAGLIVAIVGVIASVIFGR